MDATEFMKMFYQFLTEMNKVIPNEYKSTIVQIKCLIKVKNENDTMLYFLETLHPYEWYVLRKDPEFIDSIKESFPFLQSYYALDDEAKACTLTYVQHLYLLAYNQVEKNIPNKYNKKC